MTFTSYAQNFEDVMLWRALKHIQNGFFIDIGAQDPVIDSVSRAFSEHGWTGVHIEPTKQYSDKLRNTYSEETVLQIAIGNHKGSISFYEFLDTGLSTADISVAQRHKKEGFNFFETIVPIISLDDLIERITVKDVHWLKIDVEGFEKSVLEGWKNSTKLPWVIVVESTEPLSQVNSSDKWEYLLLDKGYKKVYFDGLNGFYISPEHLELIVAFNSPPNIFDDFQLSGIASQPFHRLIGSKAKQSQEQLQQSQEQLQQSQEQLQQSEEKLRQANINNQAILNSRSWRITSPLRATGSLCRRLILIMWRHHKTSALKHKLKLQIQRVGSHVLSLPILRKMGLLVLAPFPSCRRFLRRIIVGPELNTNSYINSDPILYSSLSPRAKLIYDDLKSAYENRRD